MRWLPPPCTSFQIEPPRVYTLRPRQNGRHFADDVLQLIFLNCCVLSQMSRTFYCLFGNKPALCQIMTWHRTSDMSISEPLMSSSTGACVRQWAPVIWGFTNQIQESETKHAMPRHIKSIKFVSFKKSISYIFLRKVQCFSNWIESQFQ